MAKGTLNVNSVNNYMAGYEWDDDDDLTQEEDEHEDLDYEVDENGLVIVKD